MIIRTKICGLKTKDDVETADGAGAAFLGFVFCEKSPRYVTPKQAAEISKNTISAKVAVVVDPSDELLAEIVAHLHPDFIQLHGKESEARAAEIKAKFSTKLIRSRHPALVAGSEVEAERIAQQVRDDELYDYLLIDSSNGNGIAFNYTNFTPPAHDNWFLSGGLTPENVAEAIRQTGARMVDVSSGVEREKGVKDMGLIEEFLKVTNEFKR